LAVDEEEEVGSNGLFSAWAEGCAGAPAVDGFVVGEVVVDGFVPLALELGGLTIVALVCCSIIRRE